MMRHRSFLLAALAALPISCGQDRSSTSSVTLETDRAVIAVALRDFASWNEVTFGELEGVLELEPTSKANPDATPEGIKSLAFEISDQLDDEIVIAFMVRNRSAAPVTSLFVGSAWARLQQPRSNESLSFGPLAAAKAVGSLTLPGFSADGSRALVQILHSWSFHGAVVTYVLSNENGNWQVVARDQTVFL